MQLSTEIMTHVIVFHDKSRRFITQKTYDRLMDCPDLIFDSPETGGISQSSIAKVPPIDKYYEDYPHERPPVYPKLPDEIPNNLDQRTPEEQAKYLARGRLSMIRGLQEYCDTHPGSKNAERILYEVKSGLKMKNAFAKYF